MRPLVRLLTWQPGGYRYPLHELVVWVGLAYILARVGLAWAGLKYGSFFIEPERGWAITYAPTVASESWLTARLGAATSAHIWAWTLMGGLALWIAWRTRSPTLTLMGPAFVVGLHETVWYGVYFLKHPSLYEMSRNLAQYGLWMAFMVFLLAVFWVGRFDRFFQLNPLWLAWAAWIGVVWPFGFGFRLSLDLRTGFTADYLTDWVNALEFISWAVITAAMTWSVKGRPT